MEALEAQRAAGEELADQLGAQLEAARVRCAFVHGKRHSSFRATENFFCAWQRMTCHAHFMQTCRRRRGRQSCVPLPRPAAQKSCRRRWRPKRAQCGQLVGQGCVHCHACMVALIWLPLPAVHHLPTIALANCPTPCRREMQRLQAERGDSAAFLLACLGDVRQQLLAQQGRAELGAIAEHVQQWEEEAEEAAAGCPGSPATCGGSRAAPAQHMAQLAQLPQQQREAVLLRLLEQLGVDWRAREGLLLPATSSSSSSGAAMSGAAAPAAERGSPSKLAQAVAANGKPGAAPSRPACLRSTSSVLSTGSKGACSRSELLELVQSEVRPWGGRSLSSSRVAAPAAAASHSGRRLGSVASDGSQ